jgi:hypothetical protein
MADNDYTPSDLPDKDAYIGELRQALGDLERLLGQEGAPGEAAVPPTSARAQLQLVTRQSGAAQPARMPRPVAQEALPAEEDSRDLQLLMRFVAGALILGAEELTRRARLWEEQAPAEKELLARGPQLEEASYLELARYWTLGMLAYGRRSGVSALRATLGGSDGMVPALLDLTDRATSIIFLRPLRRPVEGMIRRAQTTSRDWIAEGWREEQFSRWIAQNGVPEILEDVIAIISKNPELAELVRRQINQQSLSVASSVVESGRKLSVVGDDLAETFARRLLRRGLRVEIPRIDPKSELPPELALKAMPNDDDQA